MSIIINTERLILKKIEHKDINQLIKNLNNWNIVKWLINVPYPYTINDANNWVKKSLKDELCLNIYFKNILIGGITIDENKKKNKHILGYWIEQNHWGKGYATEACTSLISYFFLNSSAEKIYASHMVNNDNSKKILLKLGFNEIGKGRVFSLSLQTEIEDINYHLIKS